MPRPRISDGRPRAESLRSTFGTRHANGMIASPGTATASWTGNVLGVQWPTTQPYTAHASTTPTTA